jgi:hypothetical protein
MEGNRRDRAIRYLVVLFENELKLDVNLEDIVDDLIPGPKEHLYI